VKDISKALVLIALLTTTLVFTFSSGAGAQVTPAPAFEGKTTLMRPMGYREWVFVGSSLGLSYAQNPEQTNRSPMYHNVYIHPAAYREFARTGKFPQGTMMAMEMFSADVKKEPGLQGSYEKEFMGLEVSVKDSSRFEGAGWAYFNFTEGMGKLKAKAEPFPPGAGCVACHSQKAETDHVFTQFYPVLRAVAPK
jgi:cytochrome P460